ncbi:MAG: hypothetical protein BGO98_27690 [Myxococcales bacterium 68-20]|nr:MAG: hypothetical protein BGO98_27690 [Myxococcales bacterium 68-20]
MELLRFFVRTAFTMKRRSSKCSRFVGHARSGMRSGGFITVAICIDLTESRVARAWRAVRRRGLALAAWMSASTLEPARCARAIAHKSALLWPPRYIGCGARLGPGAFTDPSSVTGPSDEER